MEERPNFTVADENAVAKPPEVKFSTRGRPRIERLNSSRLEPPRVLLATGTLQPWPSLNTRVSALDVPPLTGRVVDLAHVLPTSTVESLTAQLAAHETQSSNQVAGADRSSLEGEPLEEFSHRVATTWKLGQKAPTTASCCWSRSRSERSASKSDTA